MATGNPFPTISGTANRQSFQPQLRPKEVSAMAYNSTPSLAHLVRDSALPLEGAATDYDSLLEVIGDARFVLIGEASHGTHEFYQERAEITRRLIREKGFTSVAVEADWPDTYR